MRAKDSGKTGAWLKKQVLRWSAGETPSLERDAVAAEEPLEIRVDTAPISVTMRTPGNDPELAAGFLLAEGIIRTRADIVKIEPYRRSRHGNTIDVFLASNLKVNWRRLSRHFFVSSSCGLCGKTTIEAVHRRMKSITGRCVVGASTLAQLPGKLRAAQETFSRTGGLHAAAIFNLEGDCLLLREDVGRHNAVDKILGAGLLQGLQPFDEHILVVSGRTSFEIVQKALAARVPIVAAISAPSSLAIEFARKSGQTLVGFLRGDRMNVYTGRERIQFGRGGS